MKVKKAVIPAAGFGTRMLPASKSVPKEMLPICDRPILDYVVEEAVQSGIEDILIVLSRGKGIVEDYFDAYPELELSLQKSGKNLELASIRRPAEQANLYFIRQREMRGLGHAIYTAHGFTGDEPFAVLLGDDVMVGETPVTKQLIDAAEKYGGAAVGVQEVTREDIGLYCSLDVSAVAERVYRMHSVIEKPTPEQVMSLFSILGRYVLPSGIHRILENLPPGRNGEIQLTDAIHLLGQESPVFAVDFQARRYDTGNLFGYLEANIDFALRHPELSDRVREFILAKTKELL